MRTRTHSPCHSLLPQHSTHPIASLPYRRSLYLHPQPLRATSSDPAAPRCSIQPRSGPARVGSVQPSLVRDTIRSAAVDGGVARQSGFSIDLRVETSDARNVAFNKEQTVATATTSPALPSVPCSLPIKLMKKKKGRSGRGGGAARGKVGIAVRFGGGRGERRGGVEGRGV